MKHPQKMLFTEEVIEIAQFNNLDALKKEL